MRQSPGFTIVELLIVIVIIGILASITTLAFNGVRERAYATRAQSVVDSYLKVLQMYKVDHGEYPSYPGSDSPGTWACLGTTTHYPATSEFPAGVCELWTGPDVVVTPELNSALSPYLSHITDGSLPRVNYGDGVARGAQYYGWGKTIDYYVNKDQSCPRDTKELVNGNTRCIVPLP